MEYRDRARMIDYIKDDELKDKTFILELPKDIEDVQWELIEAYASESDFHLCLYDLRMVAACKMRNINFYWAYPITSFYELNGILALGPSYVFLNAPLSFDLEKVRKLTDVPVRLCANLAYDAYIPRANGIYGTWIRPEDIKVYEPYVATVEFITEELKKEATLLHVYKDNGYWPGNLNLLFTNFNVNVDNRAIPKELGKARTTCGQRCQSGGRCHFCETGINFSNAIRKRHFELQREERVKNAIITDEN